MKLCSALVGKDEEGRDVLDLPSIHKGKENYNYRLLDYFSTVEEESEVIDSILFRGGCVT